MTDTLHGRLQAPVSRDDNDLYVGVMVLDVSEKLESMTIRKLLIECDQVNGFLTEDLEGHLGVLCRTNVAESAKYEFKSIAGPRFIINHEDCRLCS
jgi:hypothetical protein